jgi:hypothetical protein
LTAEGDLAGLLDRAQARPLVQERLRDLKPVLDRLLDPALPGRGRALFVPLGRPGLVVAFTQLPMSTAAVVDDIAHLRPLVVTTALAAGQVRHLLLDEATRWPGWRTADGRLWPAHETPPYPALAVPDLADRLIVQAYRQGGEITVLPGAALPSGVAALLRW